MHVSVVERGLDANTIRDRTSPVATMAVPRRKKRAWSNWARVALGIILAGGFYPLLLALAYTGFICVWMVLEIQRGDELNLENLFSENLFSYVGAFVVYGSLGVLIGLLWTTVVTIITLPLTHWVARSFGLRGDLAARGAFCGGLVGFIAALPLLTVQYGGLPELWTIVLAIVLGPAVTTVMGQLGGAWGAKRAIRYDRVRELSILSDAIDVGASGEQAVELADFTNRKWQFGMRHLLWFAVWLSLLFSLIRIASVPFQFMLPLMLGWIAYQASTLWLGRFLVRTWRAYRGSRSQIRST